MIKKNLENKPWKKKSTKKYPPLMKNQSSPNIIPRLLHLRKY